MPNRIYLEKTIATITISEIIDNYERIISEKDERIRQQGEILMGMNELLDALEEEVIDLRSRKPEVDILNSEPYLKAMRMYDRVSTKLKRIEAILAQ
jgi:hypothetical protein